MALPRTKVARRARVGSSIKRLIEMLRPNCSRRPSSRRDSRIEWPPRLKKLSWVQISSAGNSSSSAHSARSRSSSALRGNWREVLATTVTGSLSNAWRSTLPLLAHGKLASWVQASGCM